MLTERINDDDDDDDVPHNIKHNQPRGPVQAHLILTGRMCYRCQYVIEMGVVVKIIQLHPFTSHGPRVPEHFFFGP